MTQQEIFMCDVLASDWGMAALMVVCLVINTGVLLFTPGE